MPSPEVPDAPPEVQARWAALLARVAELDDLNAAGHLLGWDQQTMMPPGGGEPRGEVLATLTRLAHERTTDDGLLGLLDELDPWTERELPADDVRADLLRVLRYDVERTRRVPSDLTTAISLAGSEALPVWQRARAESDWAAFAPYLERHVALRRQLAACHPAEHPYDALLETYEPGMTTAVLRDLFGRLESGLGELRAAAAAEPPPELEGPFAVREQRVLALEMAAAMGFDEAHWRLDDAVHPFAQSIAPTDIRVTSRFAQDDLNGLFAVLHEVGHGLYERQSDPALARTGLGTGVSLGVHESQSRLWENFVGRSRPFWVRWLPRAQDLFPALRDHGLEGFLRAVNAVRPSLIRTEADEFTYPLHVILRFELEVALIEGDLAVADVPEAWDEGMRRLLGVTVPDDRRGALQDIHWAFGEFGYFPTYALGTIAAAQLWQAARADLPDLDASLEAGDTAPLRDWLREHVHRHGRRLEPGELLRRATGSTYDPDPLLAHLGAKLAEL
jgi:carboxypeptidase Taq